MKKLQTAYATLAMILVAAPAFAVDTAKVYDSGILILIFLGVCALFVVSQLIPAFIILFGAIKGLFQHSDKGDMATEEAGKKHRR